MYEAIKSGNIGKGLYAITKWDLSEEFKVI